MNVHCVRNGYIHLSTVSIKLDICHLVTLFMDLEELYFSMYLHQNLRKFWKWKLRPTHIVFDIATPLVEWEQVGTPWTILEERNPLKQ